ncbi:histidinol phosphate aminotransferase [Acidiplasma aeolicum]|uniref:Histidinol phosphate aminotransferase n=1 Tax=Acidiplasma aeolicum TaxID=507754 RepID=A0A0N8PQI1_9ARCH|nr:histidinol-phosphate transaminase [Acidiplasma aeolicum]KPV47189.1 histidinol phosphate aminotransferase [Acidiplasma aeolicum]
MKEIFLDKNENAFDIPENLKYELMEYIKKTPFNRYPEKGLPTLLEKIGDFLGFNQENIIAGNGSDELLNLIISSSRGNVLINSPTFEMYSFYAKNYGRGITDIPLRDDFSIDVDAIKKAGNTGLIVICSPNNPTGNLISKNDIQEVLDLNIPTILDNAYFEFSEEDYTPMINDYDNLIILRTFSKAFSMAGLRVGYGIASEKTASVLKSLQAPFYLNILSAKMAEIMIDNYSYVREKIKYIIDERERVYRHVKDIAYESRANFLYLRHDLYDFMEKKGIHIRKLPLVKDRSRITIGTKEENDIAINAMNEFMENKL